MRKHSLILIFYSTLCTISSAQIGGGFLAEQENDTWSSGGGFGGGAFGYSNYPEANKSNQTLYDDLMYEPPPPDPMDELYDLDFLWDEVLIKNREDVDPIYQPAYDYFYGGEVPENFPEHWTEIHASPSESQTLARSESFKTTLPWHELENISTIQSISDTLLEKKQTFCEDPANQDAWICDAEPLLKVLPYLINDKMNYLYFVNEANDAILYKTTWENNFPESSAGISLFDRHTSETKSFYMFRIYQAELSSVIALLSIDNETNEVTDIWILSVS